MTLRRLHVQLLRLVDVHERRVPRCVRVLLLLGLMLTAVNIINSVHDYNAYSGTDLRIRIVGARAMLRHINPYRLDHSTSLPQTLQDPDQYFVGLSRCPYPPTLLLLYAPLSLFPYRIVRVISMLLEWAAMVMTIALLARTLRTSRLRLFFVSAALIGFAGSYQWRVHVERGQYHIFATLLLAWGAYLLSDKRRDHWICGVPFGILLSFRPTVLVLLVILALARAYRTVSAAVATAVVLVIITLPVAGLETWLDWRNLVNRYADLIAGVPSARGPN
ncbi:MAG: DUF2029 domain-containing protein, partial [Chitinivibrionales bacterium]|nr:DUF2029 domain-containing protein [Chitinivibrionales bacterium]